MTDNGAVLDGYSQEYIADCGEYNLHILVRPGTDLDSSFIAWNTDSQKFIRVNGWLWTFERVTP